MLNIIYIYIWFVNTLYVYKIDQSTVDVKHFRLLSQDDFLHWLGAELGPLGLDVALPAGRSLEATAMLWAGWKQQLILGLFKVICYFPTI